MFANGVETPFYDADKKVSEIFTSQVPPDKPVHKVEALADSVDGTVIKLQFVYEDGQVLKLYDTGGAEDSSYSWDSKDIPANYVIVGMYGEHRIPYIGRVGLILQKAQ